MGSVKSGLLYINEGIIVAGIQPGPFNNGAPSTWDRSSFVSLIAFYNKFILSLKVFCLLIKNTV